MVGSVAGAEIMNDKKRTCGIRAAPWIAVHADGRCARAGASHWRQTHGYPLIGKPRCGNGARGVTILRNEAELARAFARRPDLVVQPFLDFPADGKDLLGAVRRRPAVLLFLPGADTIPHPHDHRAGRHRSPRPRVIRNLQVGGQAIRTEKVEDAQLLDLARRYGEAMRQEGWVGPVNTQSKRTADGTFVCFEMNGRFGGGTAARTQHRLRRGRHRHPRLPARRCSFRVFRRRIATSCSRA